MNRKPWASAKLKSGRRPATSRRNKPGTTFKALATDNT
jgi:hypothetical protein